MQQVPQQQSCRARSHDSDLCPDPLHRPGMSAYFLAVGGAAGVFGAPNFSFTSAGTSFDSSRPEPSAARADHTRFSTISTASSFPLMNRWLTVKLLRPHSVMDDSTLSVSE